MNSVNIRNLNGTPLITPLVSGVFTVSGGPGWLQMIPQTAADLTNGIIRFTTNLAGLAPGSYLGYVVYPGLSLPGGNERPRDVNSLCNQISTAAIFTVGSPTLTFTPLNPVLSTSAGANTVSVTVNRIATVGTLPAIPMQVTATTNDGAGTPCWLSIAPLNIPF